MTRGPHLWPPGDRVESLANPTRSEFEVPIMRRLVLLFVVATLLALMTPGVAAGGKPSTGCPAEASGFFRTDRDAWWERTVEGFEAEGITVYEADGITFTEEFDEFAAAFGFGNGAGLEFFVRVTQWAGIDHNDNGFVCMKERPVTPGNPAYFFSGADDQASTAQ
jgi:hypothetical protein